MMFSKYDGERIVIPSSWKAERTVTAEGTQTTPMENVDAECQNTETAQIGVQTDEEVIPETVTPEYSEDSLVSFLQRIAPQVEKELEKSSRSRAFVGYSHLDGYSNSRVKCLHTLRWQQASPEHIVTDVGWSCTGSIIGIAYGVGLHENWCSHKGAVAFWHINRNEFAANSPEQVMEISTCVTCLAFHPSNPAVVAVGNMSGEVTVFDMSKSQDAAAVMTGDSGGVSVSCLVWVSNFPGDGSRYSRSNPALVCATSVGTVLVWNVNRSKETMFLKTGFLVESQDVPREVRSRISDSGTVGLTSLSLRPDDSSAFLLGTEGGAILLCSAAHKERSVSNLGEVPLLKCVSSSLSPHNGRVLQVSYSPFHHHAVHTLGSDNNLRLYSLLQTNKPLHIVYCESGVTCSQWSLSRPLVVAVGMVAGNVAFYNFGNKTCESVLDLPPAERPSPISCLCFNQKSMKLMAVGDHLGRVFIWELPESIISPTATEQSTLSSIVQASVEG